MRRKKREPAGITGVWEPFDGKLKVGYKYQTQGRRVVLIVDPDEREAFDVFMFVIEGVEKNDGVGNDYGIGPGYQHPVHKPHGVHAYGNPNLTITHQQPYQHE